MSKNTPGPGSTQTSPNSERATGGDAPGKITLNNLSERSHKICQALRKEGEKALGCHWVTSCLVAGTTGRLLSLWLGGGGALVARWLTLADCGLRVGSGNAVGSRSVAIVRRVKGEHASNEMPDLPVVGEPARAIRPGDDALEFATGFSPLVSTRYW